MSSGAANNKDSRATQIAVAGLGLGLVVFLVGASAAVAVGAHPPTAFWTAGGAVSGGLLGLLVPPPTGKQPADTAGALKAIQQTETNLALIDAPQAEKDNVAARLANVKQGLVTGVPPAMTAIHDAKSQLDQLQPKGGPINEHKGSAQEGLATVEAKLLPSSAGATKFGGLVAITLAVVFVLLLALGIVLAAGAITPPASFQTGTLQTVTKAVMALATAAGSGLIGLFAHGPTQPAGGGQPQ
jgi:hypothetical protein